MKEQLQVGGYNENQMRQECELQKFRKILGKDSQTGRKNSQPM